MRRDARAYLWDASRAAELLREFSEGEDFDSYRSNAMLRSAVERQFDVLRRLKDA